MPSASKAKGNAYEREIVKRARALGLHAIRAWGSDGRSLGLHEGVDLVIEGLTVQAKRRKAIADYIRPDDDVDLQVIRQDRGDSYAIMRLDDLFQLLQKIQKEKP
jgi:hypothetical protein